MNFFQLKFYTITLLLVGIFSIQFFAQSSAKSDAFYSNTSVEDCLTPTPTPPKKQKLKPKPAPRTVEVKIDAESSIPQIFEKEEQTIIKTSEKSILTNAKVNVSLCVIEGKIKVTGWERNEVRIFISRGSEVDFKVRQNDKSTNKPNLLDIINPNSKSDKACLSGEDIEIDVPKSATIELGGQESQASFDSVARVLTETVSGNIFLSNIENGVKARTYEGLITLDKIKGNIEVESSSGGIIANYTLPIEVSDSFKARTESGVINLQNITHSRLETKSISGAIKFSGEFQNGGSYGFNTTSGAILLNVPSNSSCKILAVYGFGTFNSEIPFKVLTEDKSSSVKRTVVQMGAGEADVNVSTLNSSIKIKALKK
jgi:hypothetical protein